MDDLQRRFRSLDRVTTPNLWKEAVARSVAVEAPPRRAFKPGFALVAMALLLAALAGTIAVGAWLDQTPELRETVRYDNGIIAGSHECGRIIAIDPTSGEQRSLTGGPGCGGDDLLLEVSRGAWSADGSRLAWLLLTEETGEAWVYDAADGEARQVATCSEVWCDGVDISPDGSLLAYATVHRDGTGGLAVLDVASGEESSIDLNSMPRGLQFSPDGTQIAFTMLGGHSGIFLVDVGAVGEGGLGTPRQLGGTVDADHLSWSPDGQWIAYRHFGRLTGDGQVPLTGQVGPSGFGIVVERVDGSETRVLATGPADFGPQEPTWAPDSESLAYVTIHNDGADEWSLALWTVGIDGGEPTSIFASGCCKEGYFRPEWSPDGEWIAFGLDMQDEPSRTGTFIIRPDGSGLRRISESALEPVWQPIPRD